MYRFIFYFIVVLLFMSCLTCNSVNSKHFLFEAELTVRGTFPIQDAFSPVKMHVKNDYLILCQSNLVNYFPEVFFQAYSLSDYTYRGSFGRKGRGPGEWITPEIIHSTNNSPYFYLWDVSPRGAATVYKMALDSAMQLKEIVSFTVNKGYGFMNRPVISRDSLLVFDEFSPEPALRVHHLNQEHPVITWKWGTSSQGQHLYDENLGILCANDSCVVYLYRYQDKIDFMDWNLRLKKRLNYQKNKPIIAKNLEDNVTFYGGSFLGEHFLYAYYSGKSPREFQANSYLRPVLEVFDKDGTPVCRYSFSEPNPYVFTVDERTFTLYGYRGDNDMEDAISVYHLPGLKEYLQKNSP
ncbi:MAG: TolB-like 6-bladed beta-propeller domain-containing protein [Bacteroidales bacterium]|nr:TolB-like 6-bladed beta-propeller domain-containing protein [Bacteroidales bacterium]